MKFKKHKNGFTLIETLVAISIFAIVTIMISSSVKYFYTTNSYTVEQAFAVESARKGIEFLVRDIREASYADDGSFPVVGMATSSFEFYSDIDRDDSVELIKYIIDDADLLKVVTSATGTPPVYDKSTSATSTLSNFVRNWAQNTSVFRYYDDTGTEILDFNDVVDVAFVNVFLIVNINPSRLPNEFTLRSSATLRNLKVNL